MVKKINLKATSIIKYKASVVRERWYHNDKCYVDKRKWCLYFKQKSTLYSLHILKKTIWYLYSKGALKIRIGAIVLITVYQTVA